MSAYRPPSPDASGHYVFLPQRSQKYLRASVSEQLAWDASLMRGVYPQSQNDYAVFCWINGKRSTAQLARRFRVAELEEALARLRHYGYVDALEPFFWQEDAPVSQAQPNTPRLPLEWTCQDTLLTGPLEWIGAGVERAALWLWRQGCALWRVAFRRIETWRTPRRPTPDAGAQPVTTPHLRPIRLRRVTDESFLLDSKPVAKTRAS